MDDYEIEEEPGLSDFLPSGFGKQTAKSNVAAQLEKSKRNVLVKEQAVKQEAADSHDSSKSSNDDSDDDSDDEDEFPVSHELTIKTHDRAVTTATLDPSGSRLITGSNDCTVKFHDFASMTSTTIRAFRSLDPDASKTSANVEIHPVHQVLFNPIAPSQVLVVTAVPQAKIFTRDGDPLATFVKGDMYLRDMHNTKGHISEVTCGAWHPTNKDLCVTAGTDSTLRIWDVNSPRQQKDIIVHKAKTAGSAGRTRMTAVAWSAPIQGGPNILVAAAYDGSLVMWSGEGPYNRPAAEIREAHTPNTWTSGLDISPDGRLVVTRGGDDTIKLWDTRKFKTPITTIAHPSTSSQYPTSTIKFSPNGTNILTGSPNGSLHILNPATLRPDLITPITPDSALITAQWHPRLNQIITTSANGATTVLYNPATSTRGALSVALSAPKRRHIDDDPSRVSDTTALLPSEPNSTHAQRKPVTGLTASGKSRDPRRPHIPESTPFAKSQPDERHVRENIPLSNMRNEDPREALLRYAEVAERDPVYTNAWKVTQPKAVFAEISDDEVEEVPAKKRVKR